MMHEKNVLITGVSGFIGHNLAQYLKKCYSNCKIVGTSRNTPVTLNCDEFYAVDLTCVEDVLELLNKTKPDYIFHLAGLIFSFDLDELYRANIIATRHLLEALKKTTINSKIIMAGSAAEYGTISEVNLPVCETYSGFPCSPYGLSKLWQTLLGQYYSRHVSVITARIFNVLGYGTAQQLSTGDLFAQIQRVVQSKQERYISVGNMQIKRDFLDIDDVCGGLMHLALRGSPGEVYNICSGQSTSLQDILDLSILCAEIDVEVIMDENKTQNTYIQDIYGCNKKLKRDTGWVQQVTLENSLKKALDAYNIECYHDYID